MTMELAQICRSTSYLGYYVLIQELLHVWHNNGDGIGALLDLPGHGNKDGDEGDRYRDTWMQVGRAGCETKVDQVELELVSSDMSFYAIIKRL